MVIQAVQRVEEVMKLSPGIEKGLDTSEEERPSGRMLSGPRDRRPPRPDSWVPY